MPSTPDQAIAAAAKQSKSGPKFGEGQCLMRCRLAFGVTTIVDDATTSWKQSPSQHKTSDPTKIPAGVPVYWTGGSHGHGHIAISVGKGMCWSTDIRRTGYFDLVPIAEIRQKWGLTLVGWSEHINGERVYTPPGLALPIDLVDLSHHNSVTAAKVKAAVAGGVKGFYLKATEGTSFKDPKYAANRKLVAAAGVPAGAYHFARPKASDGTTQAKFFLSVAKPVRGQDFRVMLDLEDRGGKTKAQLTKWVGDFVAEVVRQTGVKVHLIYTPFDLADNFGWWLWVARYHPSNEKPRVPAPWTEWKVRQFSGGPDAQGVPGEAPGLGAVDLNNVVGRVSALKLPPLPAKKPTPKPVPKPVPATPADIPTPTPQPTPAPQPAPAAPKTLRLVEWNLERNRKPGVVRAEVEGLIHQTKADVLVFSEANDYYKVLAQVPGYRTFQYHDPKVPEKDGTAALVRNGLKVENPHVDKVTSDGWRTARGEKTPPKWAVRVTVEGIDIEAVSTPPSQQPKIKRHIMPARARAYDERMRNLKPSEHYVAAGDWNVTPDAINVATYPRPRFKALDLQLVAPRAGTHGKRCIDYFAVKGVRVGACTVVAGKRGSDHRPVQLPVTKEIS